MHKVALRPLFLAEWVLGVLVFVEGKQTENPEKNHRSKDENQQQTKPTCDTRSRIGTWATVVEGEHSHHCTIPVQFDTSVVSFN